MAAANYAASQPVDFHDPAGSANTARQIGRSLALLSMVAVIDTHGDAVGP
jgi:hypothetical protein